MRDEMVATSVEDGEAFFDFECPGCEACGELRIDVAINARKPFGCPERCGATFVLWQHNGQWRLTAVVVPIFKKAG